MCATRERYVTGITSAEASPAGTGSRNSRGAGGTVVEHRDKGVVMISETYDQLSTEQLQSEFLKLTEHLESFRHSPDRQAQISRELGYLAFELQCRGSEVLTRA